MTALDDAVESLTATLGAPARRRRSRLRALSEGRLLSHLVRRLLDQRLCNPAVCGGSGVGFLASRRAKGRRDLVDIVVRGGDHKGRGSDPAFVLGVAAVVAAVSKQPYSRC